MRTSYNTQPLSRLTNSTSLRFRPGRTQTGMTETQNRVHAGVPTGGQYAATAHSDAVPALSVPAPAPHDPDRHRRLQQMADDRYSAAARMLAEHDKLSMATLASGIRRDFPDATELRIKLRYDNRGSRMSPRLSSVRDAHGTNLAVEGWTTRPDAHNNTLASTLEGIRTDYIEYQNNDVFSWDYDASEVIVPLDRDYAAGLLD